MLVDYRQVKQLSGADIGPLDFFLNYWTRLKGQSTPCIKRTASVNFTAKISEFKIFLQYLISFFFFYSHIFLFLSLRKFYFYL